MVQSSPKRPSGAVLALATSLALMVLANGILWKANRNVTQELRRQLAIQDRLAQPPRHVRLPAMAGRDLSGLPVRIDYRDGRKTLLLVFSPRCGYCERNWDNWRRALGSMGDRVRVVWVDSSSLVDEAFVSKHEIRSDALIARVDPQTMLDYRFRDTPNTILISPEGLVENIWTGVLTPRALKEIDHAVSGS